MLLLGKMLPYVSNKVLDPTNLSLICFIGNRMRIFSLRVVHEIDQIYLHLITFTVGYIHISFVEAFAFSSNVTIQRAAQ